MVTLEVVENEIAKLERENVTVSVIERLACLYIVRDHLKPADNPTKGVISTDGSTECKAAINGKPAARVLDLFTELVADIERTQPRLYEAVICRLKKL